MSMYELHRRRLAEVREELEACKALNVEMLEALEQVAADWHTEGRYSCEADTMDMVAAAIAKAKGGDG